MTQPPDLPGIAFIGAGSMGGAIISGLLASGARVEGGIRAVNRTEAKAADLRRPGVLSLAYETEDHATARAIDGAGIVVLGVKPAAVPDVLEEIRGMLAPDAIVVSIAAGVTIATMEARIPNAVVRTMPNTPSRLGKGVTGVAFGSRASAEQRATVERLFGAIGSVVVVDEDRIDALSTISGSGPAYVYFLVEQLTETARRLGFDEREAKLLAEGTLIGAAALLDASGEDPAELRRRVTSPKGTTERAIAVLEDADLASLFLRAAEAALARARELAAGR